MNIRTGFVFAGSLLMLSAPLSVSRAQQSYIPFPLPATGSCPTLHCDAEATALMTHTLPASLSNGSTLTAVDVLPFVTPSGTTNQDVPGYQSCSSDDSNVACLFTSGPEAMVDFTFSTASGSLQPVRNFSLIPSGGNVVSNGEDQNSNHAAVPLFANDGSVIVADGNAVTRMGQNGSVIWTFNVNGFFTPESPVTRKVVGITPIGVPTNSGSDAAVVVSFSDGGTFQYTNIVALDFADGHKVAQYPAGVTNSAIKGFFVATANGNVPVPSSSPPTSNGNSLYYLGYVGGSINQSALARLTLTGDLASRGNGSFTQTAIVTFGGKSGASPSVFDHTKFPQITPAPTDQVVLHVPDMTPNGTNIGSMTGCNQSPLPMGAQLVSFSTDLKSCIWVQPLYYPGSTTAGISVAPVFDPVSPGYWLWTTNGTSLNGFTLYHYPLSGPGSSGSRVVNLSDVCNPAPGSNLCGNSPQFVGHMFGVNPSSTSSKLYLTVTISEDSTANQATKAVIAIDTNTASGAAPTLKWIAPLSSDLNPSAFGSALPLVTLPGSGSGTRAGLIFSGGTYSPTSPLGNVSYVEASQ